MRTLPRRSNLKCLTALVTYMRRRSMPSSVERAIEHLPRRPDERQAAEILGVAGLFADHQDARVVRARAEYRLRRRLPQVAALAARGRVPQRIEAVVDRNRRAASGNGAFARLAWTWLLAGLRVAMRTSSARRRRRRLKALSADGEARTGNVESGSRSSALADRAFVLGRQRARAVRLVPATSVPSGMPSRSTSRAPSWRGTFAPGSTVPTRFSGSSADRRPARHRRRACAPARSAAIASGNANCSPLRPATKRPPRISPRASSRW